MHLVEHNEPVTSYHLSTVYCVRTHAVLAYWPANTTNFPVASIPLPPPPNPPNHLMHMCICVTVARMLLLQKPAGEQVSYARMSFTSVPVCLCALESGNEDSLRLLNSFLSGSG